jgi:transposase
VREIVARQERGEGLKRIARALGVDRKTVRRWLRLGGWQPRRPQARRRPIDQFTEFIAQRGPEVGWNGVAPQRELVSLGFTGSYQQVPRYLKPYRAQRKWAELAAVRFETGPGEQAQADCGQLRVWIGGQLETVHLFVLTLGYSRRLFTYAYRNEKLASLLDGHARAFRRFGGVTLTCLDDNPRTLALGRRENRVVWHPLFEDCARYYGFTPHASQPYRARTKGKVESGVKYVKRNALAGRRFSSGKELNSWPERWSGEAADVRIHGTTHERPLDRFAREQLIPRGTRPPHHYEQVRMRRVANDALAAVGAARYSAPAEYVGAPVSVQESAEHYEFLHEGKLLARHQKAARHSVVMQPAHDAGRWRVSREAALPPAPRFDPNFGRLGEVMGRDLARYEAASPSAGGEVR